MTEKNRPTDAAWMLHPLPLTPEGLRNIRNHQYQAGSYTWLDCRLNPIWEYLTNLLPLWLAPNVLTVTGGVHCFALFVAMWWVNPGMNDDMLYNDWWFLFNAGCITIYYTLDCMDGKQARRTGSSSPLGQLLDHGIDTVAMLALLSSLQACLGTKSNVYLVMQVFLQMTFFCAQWEEYYTGTLAAGQFGVTEGGYGLALINLLHASIDRSVYSRPLSTWLPLLDSEVTLSDGLAVVWCLGNAVMIGLCISRVRAQLNSRQSFLIAIGRLATPILLASSLLLSIANKTLQSNVRVVSTTIGLAFALMTVKIIVFSMAKQPFGALQMEALPCVVLLISSEHLSESSAGLCWRFLLACYFVYFSQWTRSVIHQLCDHLGIRLVVIQKKL